MIIKFIGRGRVACYRDGATGIWQDGESRNVPEAVGLRLLQLHLSPFVLVSEGLIVEKQSAPPAENKMVGGAEKNKGKLTKELPPEAKPFAPENLRKSGGKKR